jgi:ABC-type branched-subunit amino acid transport system substrate-binding protein
MSEIEFYQVGGDLKSQHPSYVERKADDELYKGLKAGDFCYVLNSRQMGKSSLGKRIEDKLKMDGYACCFISLASIGSTTTIDQWYFTLTDKIRGKLKISCDISNWWKSHSLLTSVGKFSLFIETIVLVNIDENIVIFIDEIDSVCRVKFSTDDFFAVIRECYNNRAKQQEYQRLTFAFMGVASPSALIQNENCTPFNIGRAISLNGFKLHEAKPLLEGLREKNTDPESLLEQILLWTNGQPFLTQKLCQLVAKFSEVDLADAKSLVEKIVNEKIISNWEVQDNPEHLKTIRNRLIPDKEKISSNWEVRDNPEDLEITQSRLLKDEESTRRILWLYDSILHYGEIISDSSLGQQRLQLSGLVINQDGKLKIYNRIYAKVFDRVWLEQKLDALSPYLELIMAWTRSNFIDKSRLLSGEALKEAQAWREGKNLSDLENRFLSASEREVYSRTFKNIMFVGAGVLATVIGLVSYCSNQQLSAENFCFKKNGVPGKKVGNICYRNLISSGDKVVFQKSDKLHGSLEAGREKFNKADYKEASKHFKESIRENPKNPVPQIFFNNTQARLQKNPIKIAVVSSIDDNPAAATQILIGVAHAQSKFNLNHGKDNRLLEIVIVNDSNLPEAAKDVAKTLMSDESIVAVIGHHTSSTTQHALKNYEEIAVISGTANADTLKSSFFFSSLGSTDDAAFTTIEYLKKYPEIDKIVGFYNLHDEYSKALKESFDKYKKMLMASKQKLIFKDINDLRNINILAVEKKVDKPKSDKTKAVLMLSDVGTNSFSLKIAEANSKIKPTQRLKIIGLMALAEEDILPEKSFDKMMIINPCLKEESAFTNDAKERWQQSIYWRTATSFDATQALIEAINKSQQITRKDILENLAKVKLLPDQTSGFGLKFNLSEKETDYHFNSERSYCTFQVHNSAQETNPEIKQIP